MLQFFFNKNNDTKSTVSLFSSIKKLKSKFIISAVDKAENNFAIMCKVYYGNYFWMSTWITTLSVVLDSSLTIIKRHLNAFGKKLNIRISNFKFLYLFIATKFHKNSIKFWFVTCGTIGYGKVAGNFFL